MKDLKQYEVWFVTGSQHLYGPETLEQVADDSKQIAQALNNSTHIPVRVVFKLILTNPESIRETCLEANANKNCIGLIAYFFTSKNVDFRTFYSKKANSASAYPV